MLSQKNNSCTLCVPMFNSCAYIDKCINVHKLLYFLSFCNQLVQSVQCTKKNNQSTKTQAAQITKEH